MECFFNCFFLSKTSRIEISYTPAHFGSLVTRWEDRDFGCISLHFWSSIQIDFISKLIFSAKKKDFPISLKYKNESSLKSPNPAGEVPTSSRKKVSSFWKVPRLSLDGVGTLWSKVQKIWKVCFLKFLIFSCFSSYIGSFHTVKENPALTFSKTVVVHGYVACSIKWPSKWWKMEIFDALTFTRVLFSN